jgi:hypothetical protein
VQGVEDGTAGTSESEDGAEGGKNHTPPSDILQDQILDPVNGKYQTRNIQGARFENIIRHSWS